MPIKIQRRAHISVFFNKDFLLLVFAPTLKPPAEKKKSKRHKTKNNIITKNKKESNKKQESAKVFLVR